MCDLFEPSEVTSKTSSTSGPSQRYQDVYAKILKQAQGVAGAAYNPATEGRVAGFSQPQKDAFQGVYANQGVATPFVNQAQQYAQQGAAPATQTVQNYMDPYLQNVVNSTQQQFDTQNARQLNDVRAQAARAGALRGSGRDVAEALTREAQMNAQNPVIANLYSQGYGQALGAAQADAGRALSAAGVMGGLGGQAQQYGMNDINSLLGIGGMQQGLQQQQYDTATANAQQRAAYPYQNLQWLSGISSGLGSASGTTTTGTNTQPGPSMGQQLIGAGIAAAGVLSDERAKRDISEIGSTHDGQPIYRYRYAGDPRMQIGLLAQDVAQTHPEAIGGLGGLMTVDYGRATEDAVRARGGRVGYEGGGVVAPYGGVSYIPEMGISKGSGPTPSLAEASGSQASVGGMGDLLSSYKQAHSALSGLGSLGEKMRTTTDPSSGWSTTVNPSGASGWGNYLGNAVSGFGFANGGGVGRMGYADGGDVLDMEDDATGVYGIAPSAFPESDSLFGDLSGEPETFVPGYATANPSESAGVAPVALTPAPQAPVTTPEAAEQGGGLFGWSPETKNALLQAGLGIMASRSPNVGVALGEGGLRGAQVYQEGQKEAEARKLQRAKMAQSTAALQQRAQQAAEALKLRREQHESNQRYRDAQIAKLEQEAARGDIRELNGRLVRVAPDGSVSEIYSNPAAASTKAPEVVEIFDALGRRQKAMWDAAAGKYVPVGGAATPSGDTTLSREQAKADVKRVTEYKDAADAAGEMRGTLDNLKAARAETTREGPWLGVLPNWSAESQRVAAEAENVRLSFVGKTKGAVSDAEMRIFGQATPGMDMRDEAAAPIIEGMDLAARRTQERAIFFDTWLRTKGNLKDAPQAWKRFTEQKPIIKEGQGGKFTLVPENVDAWRSYLEDGSAVPAGGGSDIPEDARQYLRDNQTPEVIQQFEEKYGAGSASDVLESE